MNLHKLVHYEGENIENSFILCKDLHLKDLSPEMASEASRCPMELNWSASAVNLIGDSILLEPHSSMMNEFT